MSRIFLLISIIGVSYLGFIIFLSTARRNQKDLYRKQISLKAIKNRFQSEKFQEMLDNSGFPFKAQNINFFRFSAAAFFLFMQLGSSFIRETRLGLSDLLIPISILILTSPSKFLPVGWILNTKHKRDIIQKDGELVSFLRQYENNRKRTKGYMEFGAFCTQIAPTFEFIRHDLYELAERSIDDGVEPAIMWFCNNYPGDHHFISDVRSILLATEGLDSNVDAVEYLQEQSRIISKISSDHYKKKWTRFGDIASVVNAIPSISTFLMIVVLALQYIMLVQSSFNGVSLFR